LPWGQGRRIEWKKGITEKDDRKKRGRKPLEIRTPVDDNNTQRIIVLRRKKDEGGREAHEERGRVRYRE
jgi:hypothetical protein